MNTTKLIGGILLTLVTAIGAVWADSNMYPQGVAVERILARFAEALQSPSENIVMVRALTAGEINKLKFEEFFLDKKFDEVSDAGKAVQFYEVIDRVRGNAKYLAYAYRFEMVDPPNEWNQGVSHFMPAPGTEWIMIVSPSPISSKDIGGVRFIEVTDRETGIISAAAQNKLGVDPRDFLSDLKALSGGKKLSDEEQARLKTSAGKEIYKQFRPPAPH